MIVDRPPANGAPVGRFGRVIWPPIGTYMRWSRETGDVITPRVRSLAMDGLAHGYFAMVEAEALGKTHEGPEVHVVRGRNAEDVWPYWVTDMSRGRLLGAVADPDAVRQVANAAGVPLRRSRNASPPLADRPLSARPDDRSGCGEQGVAIRGNANRARLVNLIGQLAAIAAIVLAILGYWIVAGICFGFTVVWVFLMLARGREPH